MPDERKENDNKDAFKHPGPSLFETEHKVVETRDKQNRVIGIKFSRLWE